MLSLIIKATIGVVLCASLFTSTAHAQKDETLTKYIHEQFESSNIQSGAVAVVKDGKVSELITAGENVSASTAFGLGSISKSFTSLAIIQLSDQGKLSLDTPIRTYLPQFTLQDGAAASKITIRHLLNQTSGFSTETGYLGLYNRTISLPDSLRVLQDVNLISSPGEQFNYSNINYTLLGLVVELVSNMPYGEYMQEYIFNPLDMAHTFTDISTAQHDGLATGRTNWFGLKVPFNDKIAPAVVPEGGIMSSAEDMSHYITMLLNDGVYKEKRIISTNGLKQLVEPAVNIPAISMPHVDSYAMGWGVGNKNGVTILSHDGDTQNFHANIALIPSQHAGVIVLIGENATFLDVGATYKSTVGFVANGETPTINDTYKKFYLVLNSAVIITIISAVYGFWRLRYWYARLTKKSTEKSLRKKAMISIGLDFAYAVLLLYLVFGSGFPFVLLMYGLPDITVWLLAIIFVFLARAIIKVNIAWQRNILFNRSRKIR